MVTVERGATLLLYTDGLVEGRDLPLDEGIARLRRRWPSWPTQPLAELCDEVIERLRPEGLQDDVALVAVRLHPEDRPRPAEAGPERVPDLVGSRAVTRDQPRGSSAQTCLWPSLTYQPCCGGHLGDQVQPQPALARVAADRRRRRGGRRLVGDLDQVGVVGQPHGGPHLAAAVAQGVGGHLVQGEDQLVAQVGASGRDRDWPRVPPQLGADPGELGDVAQVPGERGCGGGR